MKKGNSLNRRSFLKAGLIGAAGTVVVSRSAVASSNPEGMKKTEGEKIVYRTLGNTGLKLPVVSMGVMRADNPALVKAALDKGIVHLDSAHYYQEGKNETMLGEVLSAYPRDSYVISSKIPPDGLDKNGLFTGKFDPRGFMEKLDITLGRLKTDHVDFLYLHGLSRKEAVLYKPVMKTLRKIKKQGKARFVGISTHRNMAEVLDAAAESQFYDVVLTAYNFQQKPEEGLQAAIENAARAGIGIIAMKTMAGGFFDKERTRPVNTRAALKWALRNEHITTAIPGYTNFDQLNESFSVMEDLSLSDGEMKDLQMDSPTSALYCPGCDECTEGCSKGLPVPDLMRAYMYTYGYRETAMAREVVLASDLHSSSPCSDCDECTVRCPRGFNVAARISDVARLRDVPAEFLT